MVALEMNYLLYKTIKARLSQYMKGCRKGYETGRLLILFFKPWKHFAKNDGGTERITATKSYVMIQQNKFIWR